MVDFHSKIADFRPTKLTLLSLLLASMMMLMGGAAVAPALPAISAAFPGESEFIISLIITLPSLAIAITGMGMGYLADRFGKVRILVISLLIFSLAGISGFFLNSIETILLGRFFVGVGIAGLTCSCTALISEYYSGALRVKLLGYQAAAMGIGALVLEISGGVLADLGWRLPFLIYGLGFIITLLIVISAQEPTNAMSPAEADDPLARKVDKRMVALCYASIFLTMFFMFALPTKLTYYIQDMGGSPTLSGLFLGLNGICSAVTSVFYRRLSDRLNPLAMLTIAFGLFASAYLLFALPASYSVTFISVSFVGLAVGFVMPTVTNALAKESSRENSGKLMGGFTMMFYFGQFLSSIVLAPVLLMAGSYGGMFAYLGCAAASIFVAFAVLLFRRRTAPIVSAPVGRPVGTYRKILIATDGSRNSEAAVEQSIVIAKAMNAELTILTVKDLAPYLAAPVPTTEAVEAAVSDVDAIADEAVHRAMKRCKDAGIIARAMIVSGSPADSIVAISRDHDLIVMGTLGRTGLTHAMIGSVAESVVRTAPCPVLVVRGEAS